MNNFTTKFRKQSGDFTNDLSNNIAHSHLPIRLVGGIVLAVFCIVALRYSLSGSSSSTVKELPDAWHGFTFTSIEGHNLDAWTLLHDKVVLVVTIGSFNPFAELNYRELRRLYDEFGSSGLEIVAFPINDFGDEFTNKADVFHFARYQKNAVFPIMDLCYANGPRAHPFFTHMKKELGISRVESSFGKFIVAKYGLPLRYYDHRYPFEIIRRHIYQLIHLESEEEEIHHS